MKIIILLTTLLVYTHCHGASKSLSKPALSQIAAQAAADARNKHEVNVKAAAAHQAAGAGAAKTYAKVAAGKGVSVDITDKHEDIPFANITKSDKCKIARDYDKVVIEFFNNKKVVILRAHSEECFLKMIELRDGRFASIHANGSVRVWDFAKDKGKECLTLFECHLEELSASIIELKDDRLVWWYKSNKDICLADIRNKSTSILKGHKCNVYLVMQLDDGRLISSDYGGGLIVWDISKEKIANKILLCGYKSSNADAPIIQLTKDKVAIGHDLTVCVFDLTVKEDDKRCIACHTHHQEIRHYSDGNQLLIPRRWSIGIIQKVDYRTILIKYHDGIEETWEFVS